MEQQTIIDGNKLVAEFMGLKQWEEQCEDDIFEEWWAVSKDTQTTYNGTWMFKNPPRFDKSWDWLMPVWTKIMGYGVSEYGVYWQQEITESIVCIDTTRHNLFKNARLVSRSGLTVLDIWEVIVDFIKWYNSTLTPKRDDLIGNMITEPDTDNPEGKNVGYSS